MIIELKNYNFIMDYIKDRKPVSMILDTFDFITLKNDPSREIYFRDYNNMELEGMNTYISLKENGLIEFLDPDDIYDMDFVYHLSNTLFIYDSGGYRVKTFKVNNAIGKSFDSLILDEIDDYAARFGAFTLLFIYVDDFIKRRWNVAKFHIDYDNPEQSTIEI